MLQLRRMRLDKGWSLGQVATRTLIDISTLSKLERGIYPAYPGWRRRLARLFQVPVDVLFAEEPDDGEQSASH